jgi:hypothetical protein
MLLTPLNRTTVVLCQRIDIYSIDSTDFHLGADSTTPRTSNARREARLPVRATHRGPVGVGHRPKADISSFSISLSLSLSLSRSFFCRFTASSSVSSQFAPQSCRVEESTSTSLIRRFRLLALTWSRLDNEKGASQHASSASSDTIRSLRTWHSSFKNSVQSGLTRRLNARSASRALIGLNLKQLLIQASKLTLVILLRRE